jgi:oligogalacturonide transporter
MFLTLGLGPDSSALALAGVCAVIGMGTSAGVLMPYAILPFVIDVDELITGEQRSGVYAGAMTLLRKLVQGLFALPAIGFMLQGIGFAPGTTQSPATLGKFFAFFIGLPGILILLGILASTRFRITPQSHAILRAELHRLRSGGAMDDASPETIALAQSLSGKPWSECWKRPAGKRKAV